MTKADDQWISTRDIGKLVGGNAISAWNFLETRGFADAKKRTPNERALKIEVCKISENPNQWLWSRDFIDFLLSIMNSGKKWDKRAYFTHRHAQVELNNILWKIEKEPKAWNGNKVSYETFAAMMDLTSHSELSEAWASFGIEYAIQHVQEKLSSLLTKARKDHTSIIEARRKLEELFEKMRAIPGDDRLYLYDIIPRLA